MRSRHDTVDLREIGSALRHGWKWIAGGVALGVLAALLLTAITTPSYRTRATILLRSGTPGPGAMLSYGREEGISLGGLATALAGGGAFDTEIEILASRLVLGEVVDSLGLQARVEAPAGKPAWELFSAMRFAPGIQEGKYVFTREGDRWRAEGPGGTTTLVAGTPAKVGGGATLTLRRGELPGRFAVLLLERESAVDLVEQELSARKAGGEVAEVVFRASDAATAAAVPNALIDRYLNRRKTVDRGVNQTRYEFLADHADSLQKALFLAEARLRDAQERSGVADPAVYGEAELEQAVQMRAELQRVEAETGALRRILQSPDLTTRDLAAFPSLLRSEAINGLLDRLLEMETERNQLLDRRTEADPDVMVLTQNIQAMEGSLRTLSRSYLDALDKQSDEMRRSLAVYQGELGALPAAALEHYRLQREVRRLSETLMALQTQLVQTRLAAIGEGGEVRAIDRAEVARRPSWPRPLLNLLGGLFGGLFFGTVAAVGAGQLRPKVREPWEAELAAGVPAAMLAPGAPLLFALDGARGVLVLPVGPDARSGPAAARLAATAALRGRDVALADLQAAGEAPRLAIAPGAPAQPEAAGKELALLPDESGGGYLVYRANGGPAHALRDTLAELEARFSPVVVALRPLDEPSTVAILSGERPVLLAARAGRVTRAELEEAATVLARLGVTLAGVVLEPAAAR